MKETIKIVTTVDVEYTGEFTREQAIESASSRLYVDTRCITTSGRCAAKSLASSELVDLVEASVASNPIKDEAEYESRTAASGTEEST